MASETQGCDLISSFLMRQGVIATAGIMFLIFTYVRKQMGIETRDLRTFVADCSKQGFQQGFGGLLMAALGVLLERNAGLDALAWYGGEYPFEMVMTTFFTHTFRRLSERLARHQYDTGSNKQLWEPMLHMGCYGPSEQEPFKCSWYITQLVQAVLFIGIPARILSVGFILFSVALPDALSPVRGVASAWYGSGMSCAVRTAFTLYVVPLLGDAVQFVIIDQIQKFGGLSSDSDRRGLLTYPATSSSSH